MHVIGSFFIKNALWILLTLATLSSFLWIMKFREKLRLTWYSSLIIAVLHTFIGVLAVRLFAFLETAGEAASGSMSLFGGIFFMPVLYVLGSLIFKREYSKVFDVFALVMAVTLFFARINCFFGGCCLGIELQNGMRVPTREIELVFYFVMINIFIAKVPKEKLLGRAYPLFMMSYGLFRFIIEFFRETNIRFGVFHISHIWAFISFVIGLVFFIVLTQKHKKAKNPKTSKQR